MSDDISTEHCKRLDAFTKFERSLFLIRFWQREVTLYNLDEEDAGTCRLLPIDPDATIELLRSGKYGELPDGLVQKDENFIHDAFGALSRLSIDDYNEPFQSMIATWFVACDDIATTQEKYQPLETTVISWIANSKTGWTAQRLIRDILDRHAGVPPDFLITKAGGIACDGDLGWFDSIFAGNDVEAVDLYVDLAKLATFLGTARGLAWARTRSLNPSPDFLVPFATQEVDFGADVEQTEDAGSAGGNVGDSYSDTMVMSGISRDAHAKQYYEDWEKKIKESGCRRPTPDEDVDAFRKVFPKMNRDDARALRRYRPDHWKKRGRYKQGT